MENLQFNKSDRKRIRQDYQKNTQSDGSSPPRLAKNTKGAQRLIMQILTGSLVIKHIYPCHSVLKYADDHIPMPTHTQTHTIIHTLSNSWDTLPSAVTVPFLCPFFFNSRRFHFYFSPKSHPSPFSSSPLFFSPHEFPSPSPVVPHICCSLTGTRSLYASFFPSSPKSLIFLFQLSIHLAHFSPIQLQVKEMVKYLFKCHQYHL